AKMARRRTIRPCVGPRRAPHHMLPALPRLYVGREPSRLRAAVKRANPWMAACTAVKSAPVRTRRGLGAGRCASVGVPLDGGDLLVLGDADGRAAATGRDDVR